MGDVTIRIEPSVDRQAVEKVRNTLSRVKAGEQVTIVMEAADAHQAGRIMEMIREEGFDYQPRGTHEGDLYQITARRIQ
ncbi:MAG: hypothetical protein K6T66_11175 [Peptococcaceae bacterium]|nr:hypothetical protein [Peptococcaceae bacterium]